MSFRTHLRNAALRQERCFWLATAALGGGSAFAFYLLDELVIARVLFLAYLVSLWAIPWLAKTNVVHCPKCNFRMHGPLVSLYGGKRMSRWKHCVGCGGLIDKMSIAENRN